MSLASQQTYSLTSTTQESTATSALETRGESFVFRGGHVCLDFLNTEVANSNGDVVDLLQTPADLESWLKEAKLIPSTTPGNRSHPVDFDSVQLENARRFRKALRELVAAIVEHRQPDDAALVEFNQLLRIGAGYPQLHSRGIALTKELHREHDPSELPIMLLFAEAALPLLTGEDAGRIRHCEGRSCVLYFLDTSKNHSRRWCSMVACGNRHKAALHYEKKRSRN